uniref:Kinesin motor domain-containing protein n=1 Tax=Panagrolaimus sp. JU765 TaxID=591449 RepID=A0AC34QAH2_9BILA
MVSPGLNCVENTLNTLRYADRVKELGSDEDGPAKPMEDSDFMLDNGSDEDDLQLLKKTIKDEETMESTILLNRILDSQEKTHDKFYELQDINEKLANLIDESQTREGFDLEHYAKDVITMCDKSAKAIKNLQGLYFGRLTNSGFCPLPLSSLPICWCFGFSTQPRLSDHRPKPGPTGFGWSDV